MKKRILDIGAGANPDIRATDAIDLVDKQEIEREKNEFFEKQYAGICEHRARCTSKPKTLNQIRFLYNIDYNKRKLPYADNSIDVIVSVHSFHRYGSPHALKEIYRILKPGGYFEIGWSMADKNDSNGINNDIKRLKDIANALIKYKFKNVKTFRDVRSQSLYHYQFNFFKLNIVRGYK